MSGLPVTWVGVRLGEIAETRLGKMLSAKAKTGVSFRPYLRNKNVQWGRFDLDDVWEMDFSAKEFERFEVVPGDLLVCEGGEVGRAAIWRGQVARVGYQKALHRVRPHAGIAPEFLLYLFMRLAQTNAFEPFVTGSTIKHLPQEDLRELPVPLPPLNEQRRIVAAVEEQFSRLDAADESLQRARHRLESLRASVLAAATAGYASVEFGGLVSDLRYGTSIKCLYEGDGLPVIRIPNIVRGHVDMTDLKFATDRTADLSSVIVAEGDLLFVRTNGSRDLIGRVAAADHVEATAFASYLIRARLDRMRLEPRYAVIALSTPAARALIEAKAATTAGQYNLNLQALRSLPIPMPLLAEQQQIVAQVEQQLSVSDAMHNSIETAGRRSTSLRRSILERAFRGELVPQDPDDEPASVLLERLAAGRATAETANGRRPRRRATMQGS